MSEIATDTFSWVSFEPERHGEETRETVDFANILEATKWAMPDAAGLAGSVQASASALPDHELDACDGILAQERLEDAEWVDWSDVKRELHRQD